MLKKPYVVSGETDNVVTQEIDQTKILETEVIDIKSKNSEDCYVEKNINDQIKLANFKFGYNGEVDDFSKNSDFNSKYYVQQKYFQNVNNIDDQFANELWLKKFLDTQSKLDDYYEQSLTNSTQLEKYEDIGQFDPITNTSVIKRSAIINCGAVDKSNFKPIDRFNFRTNGKVTKIISDSNGNLYLIGNFTSIMGVARNKFAKISNSGVVTDFIINPLGNILDIAIYGNKLILAGSFTKINNITRPKFASFDIDTETLDGNAYDIDGEVRTIAVASLNKVLIGGTFTVIDSLTRNRTAVIDVDNLTLESETISLNAEVNSAFWDDVNSYFYIGGNFTNLITSTTHNYLFRADNTLTVDDTKVFNLDDQILQLCPDSNPDSGALIFGAVTKSSTLDSIPVTKTCALNETDPTVFIAVSDNFATGMFSYDKKIYFIGPFVNENVNIIYIDVDPLSVDFNTITLLSDLWSKNIDFEANPDTNKNAIFVNEEYIYLSMYENEFGNFNLLTLDNNIEDYDIASIGDLNSVQQMNKENFHFINDTKYYETFIDNFNGLITFELDETNNIQQSFFRNKYKNNQLNSKFNKFDDFNEYSKILGNYPKVNLYYSVFPMQNQDYSLKRNNFIFFDWVDYIFDKSEEYDSSKIVESDYCRISNESTWRYTDISTMSCHKSIWPLDLILYSGSINETIDKDYIFGELRYFNSEVTRTKPGFLYNINVSLSYNGFAASASINTWNTSLYSSPFLMSLWDVPYKTNSKPFFNKEDEFNILAKKKYSYLSQIAEYNASENIDNLLNNEQINNLFTVTGSSYYHTDFKIQKFVDRDIENISFNLEVLKLFRPYDGLYPVQQGLRLASILSQSIGANEPPSLAMTYFYRPGIFWNSLTCGIPMHDVIPKDITQVPSDFYSIPDIPAAVSNLEIIPFETIYKPHGYYYNKSNFSDVNENKIVLFFQTSSYGAQKNISLPNIETHNNKYYEICKSFFSSFNDFYLKNESEVKFKSCLEKELPVLIKDVSYGLRITVKKTCNIKDDILMGDNGPNFSTDLNAPLHTPLYEYSDLNGTNSQYDLNCFKIIFIPDETRKYTFSEIISGSALSYSSLEERIKSIKSTDFTSKWQSIESFMDIMNFEQEGDSFRWCPKLKQEIPALNYDENNHLEKINNISEADRTNITGVSEIFRGYLYSYGKADDKGLFLEIEDLVGSHELTDTSFTSNIQSLAEIMGFKDRVLRIGELKPVKEVSELVCIVPYDVKSKKMINIHTNHANFVNNINYFDKYVFPKEYDYKYGDIQPYLFYAFETKMTLEKEDISKIWQNVMPSQSFKFENDTMSLNETDKNICNMLLSENITWKIFKLKKKANYNSSEVKYNYPYDFFSIIEGVNLKISINYEEK